MTTYIGTKLKMTQVFKDDKAFGVTPVQLEESSDISKVEEGSLVMVSAISKGKGFAGVVKRWGFKGGPKSHGQKHSHRAPGSIGSTGPAHVFKGRKMGGRMGGDRITTKNIKLVTLDKEKKILMLNGAVPGITGREVEIKV